MLADRGDSGSGSHSETKPTPPGFLATAAREGAPQLLMNLEQTDRVRAETANESSSERASGDSTGFPPWGEGVELCSSQAQVGSKLRLPIMQTNARQMLPATGLVAPGRLEDKGMLSSGLRRQ